MNTPRLIVMGAMKAGTTTAYELLEGTGQVTMLPKEAGWLRKPRQLDTDSAAEVCSDYTRLHRFPELLTEATRSLPLDTPLLYILRDPVDRAISHASHLTSLGDVDRQSAFEISGDIVQTSSYGRQLSDWRNAGFTNIELIDFHRLGTELPGVVGRLLGVDLSEATQRAAGAGHANPTSNLRSARSFIRPIVRSRPYRSIRSAIPRRLRDAAKNSRLTSPAGELQPAPDQLRRMVEHFSADLARLGELDADPPGWVADWPLRPEKSAR